MDEGLILLSAAFECRSLSGGAILSGFSEVDQRRRQSQPSEPSLGSFFRRSGDSSIGALIDALGLKGRRVGGAAISEKHAGFIVNSGGATICDVLDVARIAENEIFKKYGFVPKREAEIIE